MNDTSRAVRRGAREAAPWVDRLARLGYAAKGIVYVVVGVLAVRTAAGAGGDVEGTGGALGAILAQPFGKVVLAVVALGLVGYVVWRLVQATLDPEGRGTNAEGVVKRIGFGLSAVAYAALALQAAKLLTGNGGGSDSGTSDWTARLLEAPAGRWLVGLAGLGALAFGLYECYRASRKDLARRLDLSDAPGAIRRRVVGLGRVGYAARGVVFLLTGWFLVRAARQFDPSEAQGLAGALEALRRQPAGPWLLGLVALGLAAYGAFQLVQARYRRIPVG